MHSSLENFIQGFSIFKVIRKQVIICQDCTSSGSSLGTEHGYETVQNRWNVICSSAILSAIAFKAFQ